jgi:hypothetical protein
MCVGSQRLSAACSHGAFGDPTAQSGYRAAAGQLSVAHLRKLFPFGKFGGVLSGFSTDHLPLNG